MPSGKITLSKKEFSMIVALFGKVYHDIKTIMETLIKIDKRNEKS